MLSGRHKLETTRDGSFFIDRDGTHFRFILNYLRDGKLILPEGAIFLKELEAEAKYYQLQGILDALKPKEPFEASVILTNEEHQRVLKSWLPEAMKGEYRLLFRASRDAWLCCFNVSFPMRQRMTYSCCCKKWWKHFWRLH